MATAGDMHTFVQTTIPKALSDLLDSNNNIKQIATYCKSAYLSKDQAQVYDQTREYTKECILNVAYHVQTIGTHISTLLDLQTTEIDKLDIQIRALTDRVKACHEAAGATGFRVKEANKVYVKTSKVRKLEGAAIPEAAKQLRKYTRQPVNYSVIEGGGSIPSNAAFNNPPPSVPPPAASHAPTYFVGRASIALGAPPPTLVAPPSFSAPPPVPTHTQSFSNLPPPPLPPHAAGHNPSSLPPPLFDMPPPPPFDFGAMPPPPPAFDGLLPPPPLDFGPPPPLPPR
eukprot:Phypoly_transcript_15216.p1 GENE.Phypoly_transcript_15216~~Phypoly_transcript_15216.p1  ORF type:complete len:285 (+),score=63.54 Phypoly_transcript_15216:57-911(+)